MSRTKTVVQYVALILILAILGIGIYKVIDWSLKQAYSYPTTGVVVGVSHETDTVRTVDGAGNIFTFFSAEDWQVGDLASMLMYDKGTPEIADDEIVKVRYSGSIYDWRSEK